MQKSLLTWFLISLGGPCQFGGMESQGISRVGQTVGANSSQRAHVLWVWPTNSHGLQKSCGERGTAWPLSKWERGQEGERALTPAWTGFYWFSGYITSRMVLIYYAQVLCRWLPFTDNKGKNVPEYPFVALFSHTHIKRTRPPSPVLSSFCTHRKILGLLSTKMFFLYFPNVFYSNSAYKNANYFSQNFLTFNT